MSQRGAATVWTLALVQLLLLVGLAIGVVGGIAMTRQRAATVADLAAVAGAQSAGPPCDAVAALVHANAMALVSCEVEEGDVLVEVDAPVPAAVARAVALLGRGPPTVRQAARAGPPAW